MVTDTQVHYVNNELT